MIPAEQIRAIAQREFEKLHGNNRPDPTWRPEDESHTTFPAFEDGFITGFLAAINAKAEPVALYPCGFKNLHRLVIEVDAFLARNLNEGEPVTDEIRSAAMALVNYAKDMSSLLSKQPLYTHPAIEPEQPCSHFHQISDGLCTDCGKYIEPAPCTDDDKWNCKYCGKIKTCEAIKDSRNFGKPIGAAPLPEGCDCKTPSFCMAQNACAKKGAAPSEFGVEQRDKDWTAFKGAAPLNAPPEANWTEDFAHENGQYQCLCCKCEKVFMGHKRRTVCKLCAAPLPDDVAKMVEALRRHE